MAATISSTRFTFIEIVAVLVSNTRRFPFRETFKLLGRFSFV